MVKKPPSSSYIFYNLLGAIDDSRQMCISSFVFFVRDKEVTASLLGLGAIDAPSSKFHEGKQCLHRHMCIFFSMLVLLFFIFS